MMAEEKGNMAVWVIVAIWVTSSCTLLTLSGPSLDRSHVKPFPFDNRTLLCISNSMPWWIRHLVQDRQFRLNGDMMFSLYCAPVVDVRLVSQKESTYQPIMEELCSKTQSTVIHLSGTRVPKGFPIVF